jgi:hypothetical protein
MGISAGLVAAKLAYTASPIILTGGIAANLGNYLPIIALTQGGFSAIALLTGKNPIDPDNLFANFVVLPGGMLVSNQVATYSFANQAIGANAIIAQQLPISVKMICPARGTLGYAAKLATMSALKSSLAQHTQLGGLFSVVTPSLIYTNCILTGMRDISGGGDKQVQVEWQLDFIQYLVTLAAAQAAFNSLTSSLTNATPIGGVPASSAAGLPIGGAVSPLVASFPAGSGL